MKVTQIEASVLMAVQEAGFPATRADILSIIETQIDAALDVLAKRKFIAIDHNGDYRLDRDFYAQRESND